MECPKCNKGTCVLVTERDKKRKRERVGLLYAIWRIITWPFRFIWRLLFGRKEKYYKTTVWHCNYCGNKFKDKGTEE